jgi:hypothetical protein
LVAVFCTEDEADGVRTMAFFAVLRVGLTAISALREAWDRETSQWARAQIHRCMMDIVNPLTKEQLLPVAAREIPLWIQTLKTEGTRVQCWAVYMLGLLTGRTGLYVEEVRQELSDFARSGFAAVEDPQLLRLMPEIQRYVARTIAEFPESNKC